MMKIKLLFLVLLSIVSESLFAQTQENLFYSNGKIYVVVAVMTIIFTGIVVYLTIIDRRLKKTEKELKDKK